jgi:hypothetical protein
MIVVSSAVNHDGEGDFYADVVVPALEVGLFLALTGFLVLCHRNFFFTILCCCGGVDCY